MNSPSDGYEPPGQPLTPPRNIDPSARTDAGEGQLQRRAGLMPGRNQEWTRWVSNPGPTNFAARHYERFQVDDLANLSTHFTDSGAVVCRSGNNSDRAPPPPGFIGPGTVFALLLLPGLSGPAYAPLLTQRRTSAYRTNCHSQIRLVDLVKGEVHQLLARTVLVSVRRRYQFEPVTDTL